MKRHLLSGLVVCASLLAGCATTPQSRIEQNRAIFDQFPAEVQAKVRAGQVEVGFTEPMVRLALGNPARTFTRSTAEGNSVVWVYTKSSPSFSFGFGVGSYGGHSGVSGGVGITTGGSRYDPDEVMRVEFREGAVAGVEHVSNRN